MTITEALAEIKTIVKRIQSKREFIRQYMLRVETLKDPFEKDGGSAKQVEQELQAVADLEQRLVDLRHAIQYANENTALEIEGTQRSIADWIIWRREVAPVRDRFLHDLNLHLRSARDAVKRQPNQYGVAKTEQEKPLDIVVSIDEKWLNTESEKLKNILGQLDGQLSLKNATVMVKV